MSESNSQPNTPRYLLRWDHSQRRDIRDEVVVSTHRMGEFSLGDDGSLVDLINRYNRKSMLVHTMGHHVPYPNQLRLGSIGNLDGNGLLHAAKSGRLQLTLPMVQEHCETYQPIVSRLANEIAECHLGLRIKDATADLVISSPTTIEYLQCDARPMIDWQLRGTRKIRVYEREQPFLHSLDAQRAMLSNQPAILYFDPEFDLGRSSIVLSTGEMCSLPSLSPFRSETVKGLSVWLRLRFDTPQHLQRRQLISANCKLSKYLPNQLCGAGEIGMWAATKRALTRMTGPYQAEFDLGRYPFPTEATFVVDPSAPDAIGRMETADFPGTGANSNTTFQLPTNNRQSGTNINATSTVLEY